MRGLLLFLSVVVAFFLVLRFYPSAEVEGATTPEPQAPRGPQGQTEDAFDAPAGAAEAAEKVEFLSWEDEPAAEPVPEAPARAAEPEDPGRVLPSWLEDVAALPVSGVDEVRLASILLHGTIGELHAFFQEYDLPADRRQLHLAFLYAVQGDRQRALAAAEGITGESGTSAAERDLLRAALRPEGASVRVAGARKEGPVQLAMEMALVSLAAEVALAKGRAAAAAVAYSDLILFELDAPWESDPEALDRWSEGLAAAQDGHRWNPGGDWPAEEVVVQEGDSLDQIGQAYRARHPGRPLSSGLIHRSNRLRRYIQPGQTLRIPTDVPSVLVDLDARRVVFLMGGEAVACWRVGVGRPGQETITGSFVAGDRQRNPTWFPPGEDPVPFGHPENPLGTRWISWKRDGENTSYGFHGTNEPETVGTAASDGCIRFRNADVEALFEILPRDTPILVRD